MPTIVAVARRVAQSRHPAVRLAKRAVTNVLHRVDLVARARLTTGDVLYVDLGNAVGRTIWLHGDYSGEAAISNLIAANLRASDVFFDVGANVGFFTVMAARIVGDSGHVYAFEPLPRLARLLRKSAARNLLGNVTIIEAVVGKTQGRASVAAMTDSAYSHVMDGALAIDDSHGTWKPVSVESVTLDEYVGRVVRRVPRLIKMDIEGSEIEAIDGARSILSQADGPDVICEVGYPHLARFGHTPEELFGRFQAMGFVPLNPNTGREMRLADLSEHNYNVFFKKPRS
jgi:FkbM family methyltransferase